MPDWLSIFKVNCMGSNNPPPKKGPHVATTVPARRKSAEDELLESFGELIDSAAEKMTDEEFAKAAKKSNATLDRAIASHSRRRGTA
jgi:hypothetical protein